MESARADCVAARVICTMPISNQHMLAYNSNAPASDRQEGSLCYPEHIPKGGRFGPPVVCTSQRRGVREGVGWRITCDQIHPPVRSQTARPSQLCKCSDLGLTSTYVTLMDGLIMWRGWLVACRVLTTIPPLPESRPGTISIPGFSNPPVYKALMR